MTTPTKTRTVALKAETWQKLRILTAVNGRGIYTQIEALVDTEYDRLYKNGLPAIAPPKRRGR